MNCKSFYSSKARVFSTVILSYLYLGMELLTLLFLHDFILVIFSALCHGKGQEEGLSLTETGEGRGQRVLF